MTTRVAASNARGLSRLIGSYCKGPAYLCADENFNLRCSSLSSARWKALRRAGEPANDRRFTYSRYIQECRTLIGMTRTEAIGWMGRPDASGRLWVSWDIGYNYTGDLRTFEVDLRAGRVVSASGRW